MKDVSVLVNEIFTSIQGEGPRVGRPTHFIRLQGCNLKCSFCDTTYALGKGQGTLKSVALIDEGYIFIKTHDICITGGEPGLQWKGVDALMQKLKYKTYSPISIETNGTIPPTSRLKSRRRFIAIVSPKHFLPKQTIEMWIRNSLEVYIKLVMPGGMWRSFDAADRAIQYYLKFFDPSAIFLMPCGNTHEKIVDSFSWLQPLIKGYGVRLSPRLQIDYEFK